MTSIGSPSPFFFGGKKAYEVQRSLRFNGADGPYLEHTPSSHSNKRKMTFSFWFKRAVNTNFVSIFRAYGNSSNRHSLDFVSGGQIRLWGNYNGSVAMTVQTTQVFRDFSAWYHFVLVLDTEQGTASNRVKMYVNGVQITDFATASYPSQNFDFAFNDQNAETQIGVPSDTQCNFYIAEFQEIDGLALDPSYFGETDALTGQWNPKKYTGSYGTNGFYLNFSDNSGTTATTLGKDSSGNGNNFTPNNFSVAAGAGNDSVIDTPTNNFCTLNPLDTAAAITTQNGNLQIANASTGNYNGIRASFGSKTGKYYWEIKFPNTGYITGIGIARADGRIDNGNQPTYRIVLGLGSWFASYNSDNVNSYVNANPTSDYGNWSGASNYSANDIYMIAVDFDAGKIWWGKNGSWFNNSGTANPSTGTDPRHTFTVGNQWFPYSQEGDSSSCNQSYNFGQQGFAYTPPSGFVELSSANLPDPTIKLPNKHFDTLTYTGNGSSPRTISGLQFSPDFVWLKHRSGTSWHRLQNSVVGANKLLYSNSTNAEATDESNGHLNSFTSDGFIIDDPNADGLNNNGGTYVGWNWNAGDTDGKTYVVTVVSDSGNKYRFDGFGTSAVTLDLAEGGNYIFNMDDSSNASHPFSIGTAANGTVYTSGITYFLDGVSKTYSEYTSGFSSASTRRLHITVPASAPVLYYWCSAHSGMGGQINTNSTLGSSNFDGTIQSVTKVNASAGFSITKYTATGSAGATVGHGLGVKPDVIITKRTNDQSNWGVYHSEITADKSLFLNLTNAAIDNTTYYNDTEPTSTVFTLGGSNESNGTNGDTYIGYFFSEVVGYSKFGSYTGNGNADGTFVFTGFRPAWIMIKRTDTTKSWPIFDNKRDPDNVASLFLYANSSGSENNSDFIDFLSNGFKFRTNSSVGNDGGNSYIYLAFAEAPFKNARAR